MNVLHVIEQGDAVLLAVFALLAAMSVVSWQIILWKCWQLRAERAALAAFKSRTAQVADWPLRVDGQAFSGGVGELLREADRLKAVLPNYIDAERTALLALHLPQCLDRVRAGFDQGLTALASIGSSGPFIGLFGTVWGIYGALAQISAEGNASLNTVAGPMGEALVATAFGLFAAIPAVLAYNAFVRSNRILLQDLRHVAEQLATYLPMAQAAPVRLAKGAN